MQRKDDGKIGLWLKKKIVRQFIKKPRALQVAPNDGSCLKEKLAKKP